MAGLQGTVSRATLRLYTLTKASTGIAVRAVASNPWSEATITYRNAPPFSPSVTASSGSFVGKVWLSLDVTPLVSGNGSFTFALTTHESSAIRVASKENGAATAPQLVVETSVAPAPPANTSTPAISGLAEEGRTLTGSAGAWSGTEPISYAYQWRRCDSAGGACADVPGATGTSYALTTADVGSTFRVSVTATNAAGSANASSAPSAVVVAAPQPPPPSECTKTTTPGNPEAFLNSAVPGDVMCLRGGVYTGDGQILANIDGTATARITIKSYPGERAEIVGSELLANGNYTTVRDLAIRDVTGIDYDGLSSSGTTGVRFEYVVVARTSRHNILLHSDAGNLVVHGARLEDAGAVGSSTLLDSQIHGIYAQQANIRVSRTLVIRPDAYGLQLYPAPSDVVVAENTFVGSRTRAGLLMNCSARCTVANNVSANNAGAGYTLRACSGGGCVVDTNLAWGNGSGSYNDVLAGIATGRIDADPQFIDADFRVALTSPAVDRARADFAYFPDLGGVAAAVGGGPDLGAYER